MTGPRIPARVLARARLRSFVARLLNGFHRGRLGGDLDDEIAFHLDRETERNIQQGMTPERAHRLALLAFGGVQQVREDTRSSRGLAVFDAIGRDARYAFRSLRFAPLFTTAAALTMALGIGAVTSVYNFSHAVFLRPLVPGDGSRIARVYVRLPDGRDGVFGHRAVRLLADHAKSFDLVAEHYSQAPLYVATPGWQAEIQGAVVSADYFKLLQVSPRVGRFFTAREDLAPDHDAVAVISEALWRDRFGGDSAIFRQPIAINGRAFSIIGVAPAEFAGAEPDRFVDRIWIPTSMFRTGYRWCDPLAEAPPCAMSHLLVRLAPNATIESARAELSSLRSTLVAFGNPGDSLRPIAIEPAVGFSPGSRAQYTNLVRLLWGISVMLLLIACTNLAGLLLARGFARRREVALRRAIGAGTGQIVRQLVIENTLLGVIGSLVGLAVSGFGAALLAGFFTTDNEGYRHALAVRADGTALLFALGCAVVASVFFGLLPALAITRTDLVDALKSGDRGSSGGSRGRHVLVAAQIALSVVLLAGATLLTRSVSSVLNHQRFESSRVALMRLRPRLVGYDSVKAHAYLSAVVRELRAVPGVQSVGLARGIGFVWNSQTKMPITLPSDVTSVRAQDRDAAQTIFTTVSPRFFATLGVPIDRGRDFTDADTAGSLPVAIVNRALSAKLWPGSSPIGRTIVVAGQPLTVVGVVANYRVRATTEADAPMAFGAFWQNAEIDARVAIRLAADPGSSLASLAKAARQVDPAVPVTELLPMSQQVAATFSDIRLARSVLVGAGAAALGLSVIGLYGIVAFSVGRRRREVGVRVAVGARQIDVIRLFVRQNMRWAAFGTLIGAAAAFAASRLIASWLVGVEPSDPVSFAAAIVVVTVCALVGTLVPSWQAARIPPTTALRVD